LTYADAVHLLGGSQQKVVSTLERLTGGLLLGASAAGAGFALSLFDPTAPFARLSGELITAVRGRLDGLGRFERTERLAAAHAVLVLAAFFEELAATNLPFDTGELELTAVDHVRLATGDEVTSARIVDLGRALLRRPVPCPAPQWPYEVTVEAVGGYYADLADNLVRFVQGLAVWDRLDENARRRTTEVFRLQHVAASRRYEEMFRQLAVEVPEVAFWANLVDHQATRAQLARMSESLAGLGQTLDALAFGRAPDDRRLSIARSHRAALDRPVLASGEAPPGVCMPSLERLYVNPSFRVTYACSADELASEDRWQQEPVREDLQEFLVGFLTGPEACDAPMLVLGQPGSGKSALSKVLAARLPPTDFLAVVVSLREVPADADVQTQIEYAIRYGTGEAVTWPELARSAGDALPVLVLDGFDELVQATGTTQSDYLERVAGFQRREAEQRRPTAVIITSRTTVADRARSVSSMIAVRLEPFDGKQIRRWLQIWNEENRNALAARRLQPLPLVEVLKHPSLAAQPLLLLMLALYDSDDNALQRRAGSLAGYELYESLLTGFARREVTKTGGGLSDAAFERAVEHELTGLSVVAFAMFNRHRQWATQAELNDDLTALLGAGPYPGPSGMRVPLTAGETAVSRFYFVHQSQAVRGGDRLRTYEFLHATFGEYLIARVVIRELTALIETSRLTSSRGRVTPPDDDFLHALLSFSALTSRNTVVNFLREGCVMIDPASSGLLKDQLLLMFHRALFPRRSRTYDGYQPQDSAVTGRHAAWSANLTMLAVLAGGDVTAKELFPAGQNGVTWWRQISLLWRSQLSSEGWNGMVHALDVSRERSGDERVLRIRLANGDGDLSPIDLDWAYAGAARRAERDGGVPKWRHYGFADLRRHSQFHCDRIDDTVMHAVEPFGGDLEATMVTVHQLPDGSAVTPARALLELVLADDGSLLDAYERCLIIAQHGFLSTGQADTAASQGFRAAVARLLSADEARLPAGWPAAARQRLEPG
jgi:hypothetical protein